MFSNTKAGFLNGFFYAFKKKIKYLHPIETLTRLAF